jgi:hypothetical protein
VNFIVVLEPSRQQSDYGLSIRQDRQPSIIAFEGFDECLRDAVGFRRADWRETKLEAQGRCGVERVLGDVSRAVVGQPFDGMRRLADPESTLDASDHQVAHHLAGDAGGRGQPRHDLAIAGIDSKQHTHDLESIEAGDATATFGRSVPFAADVTWIADAGLIDADIAISTSVGVSLEP